MIHPMKNLALIACLGIASSAFAMDVEHHITTPRKPVPLKNIGSTSCFMNAAIQVAYAMHDVTSLLFEQSGVYKKDSLAKAYVDLLPHFMFSESFDKEGFDPEAFCFLGWHQLKSDPFKQADTDLNSSRALSMPYL